MASSHQRSPSSHSDSDTDARSRWALAFSSRRSTSSGDFQASASSPRAHPPVFDSAEDEQYSEAASSLPPHASSQLALGPPLMGEARRPSTSTHSAGTYSDTFDGIRDDTALLSDMLLSPSASGRSLSISQSHPHIFADRSVPNNRAPPPRPILDVRSAIISGATNANVSDDEDTFVSGGLPASQSSRSGENTPRALSPTSANRSILTMLLARERVDSTASNATARPPLIPSIPEAPSRGSLSEQHDDVAPRDPIPPKPRRRIPDEEEGDPLLVDGYSHNFYGSSSVGGSPPAFTSPPSLFPSTPHERFIASAKSRIISASKFATPKVMKEGVLTTFQALPAVLLGLLLNILDGVSYGFIIFPAGAIFGGFGSLGVSMFFLTTVVSQLVYSFGGSSFAGATSSMIIEVIPFFHIIAAEIVSQVGEDNPQQVIATTMVAFAFSSILTGVAFLLFGLLKLGSVIGFFPRHILVGCIGGVGVFLIQTGLNVSAGMGEEEADLTWRLLKLYFTDTHVLSLWIPAFVLAVLLRIITHKYHHQLIFPMYFVALPIIFYIIVFIAGFDVDTLRAKGWVFDVGESREPWYKFYSYFDIHQTSMKALLATMPTQLALLFFNVLHPPLNVPALAVSLNKDDVDLNLELTGHGVSNLVAGFLGVPSNYLAYVNTLLFYRVGGTTRYAGFLLAVATSALLFVGTGPIAYIPVLEVGALIFVLGIDLVKEAVWDTRHRASLSEYITILGIMLCMTLYDFVSGVLFGIIVASLFFVIQNSRRESIRNIFTGATATSTVRRPSAHRQYLQEVGTQTCIIRLQGHLFFGTIAHVEDTCRAFLDAAAWERNPIRFLIVDLALVSGLDLSAAEAMVRIQRLLVAKRVILVFCGQQHDSDVAKALHAVELWSENAEVFASLNEALEWTENAYLRAWYTSPVQKQESHQSKPRAMSVIDIRESAPFVLGESFVNSPRQNHVQTVGSQIMDVAAVRQESLEMQGQPYNTIIKTFSSHADLAESFLSRIAPYFKTLVVPTGETVYTQGDQADGLYLIESGVLRATYSFADRADIVEESCVAGTLSGELSALAGEPRNATVVAERQAVLWKLSTQDLAKLEKDHPEDARLLIKLVLKSSKIDQDMLLASLAQHR